MARANRRKPSDSRKGSAMQAVELRRRCRRVREGFMISRKGLVGKLMGVTVQKMTGQNQRRGRAAMPNMLLGLKLFLSAGGFS